MEMRRVVSETEKANKGTQKTVDVCYKAIEKHFE